MTPPVVTVCNHSHDCKSGDAHLRFIVFIHEIANKRLPNGYDEPTSPGIFRWGHARDAHRIL